MCCDHDETQGRDAFAPHPHPQRLRTTTRRKGFSLIEVMVVVVIIALLASIVGYNVAGYMDRARQNKARADLAVLVTAVKSYYADHGRYPSTSQWPDAIVPAYIEQLPRDPWGNQYQYEFPGRRGAFDIICFGADGREGGENSDRDLSNWDLDAQPESNP